MVEPIESPCILVCTMDLDQDLCLGCGRTREEIALWSRFDPAQRRVIMGLLPARLERLREPKT